MLFYTLISLCAVTFGFVTATECPVTDAFEAFCVCKENEIRCSGIGDHENFPPMFTSDITGRIYANITVENSNITNIPNRAFAGIQVRELFLTGCHIETIEEEAFRDQSSKLEALYLSHNQLRAFEPGTFARLGELIRLKLDFNLLTSIDNYIFSQLPRLRNLHLHENLLSSLGDNALPRNLESLALYRNRLGTLPEKVFHGLAKLERLNIRENQFTDFPTGLFRDSASLTDLDLSWTNLTAVNKDLFQNTIHLRRLDLALNNIYYVHPEALNQLQNITFLDLSNNKIQVIPGPLFANLSQLRTLYLSKNALTQLPDDMSHGMPQLRTLHIQFNQLSHIGRTPLRKLIQLEDLRLDHNLISHISLGAFDHLGMLKRIDLSDNLLETLYNDPFTSKVLQWVDLSNNMIYSVTEEYFRGLNDTEFIDLSGNRIVTVEAKSFNSQKNLKYLNLTGNWLQNIEDGTFEQNGNITRLSLDNNPLQQLSNEALNGLASIRTIFLNRTCLKELPGNIFLGLDSLETIHMSNSRMNRVINETFSDVTTLTFLDLSHNDIRTVESGAFAIPYIETLMLSHNQIDSSGIRATTAGMSSYVQYLDISHNRVTDLDGIEPLIFDQIRNVYFSGNPFICNCQSNTFWIRTLFSLKDYDTVACDQPSYQNSVKVVCFEADCKNDTYMNYPFSQMCNLSSNVDMTSQDYIRNAQHIRTRIPDVCDLSRYTLPTSSTLSTRPVTMATRSSSVRPTHTVQITVDTTPGPRAHDVDVIWQVTEDDMQQVRGYIVTLGPLKGRRNTIHINDPDKSSYNLRDLDPDQDYEVCVQAMVTSDDAVGQRHCEVFRTDPTEPLLSGTILIIVITVVVVIFLIIIITIIVCVCLCRQKKRRSAKEVGVKRTNSSLLTQPQAWLAPDVTLVGDQNDLKGSDAASIKDDKLHNGHTPSEMFDGTNIWLDAGIMNEPDGEDFDPKHEIKVRRGNSELSLRPEIWMEQNHHSVSRSASDLGRYKNKQKSKKQKKDRRDSMMGRAGMWVDSFAEHGEINEPGKAELGEQSTLSMNIFGGKDSVSNGGPPSAFWK